LLAFLCSVIFYSFLNKDLKLDQLKYINKTFNVAANNATSIPLEFKIIRYKTMFTDIIAAKIKAKPFHLFANSNIPAATSVNPTKGHIYPVFINASINASGGGVGKK